MQSTRMVPPSESRTISAESVPLASFLIPEGCQPVARGREAHPGFQWETRTTPEGLKGPQPSHPCRGAESIATRPSPGACFARPGAIGSHPSGMPSGRLTALFTGRQPDRHEGVRGLRPHEPGRCCFLSSLRCLRLEGPGGNGLCRTAGRKPRLSRLRSAKRSHVPDVLRLPHTLERRRRIPWDLWSGCRPWGGAADPSAQVVCHRRLGVVRDLHLVPGLPARSHARSAEIPPGCSGYGPCSADPARDFGQHHDRRNPRPGLETRRPLSLDAASPPQTGRQCPRCLPKPFAKAMRISPPGSGAKLAVEPFLGVGVGIGIGIDGDWGSIPMAIPTPTPMSRARNARFLRGS